MSIYQTYSNNTTDSSHRLLYYSSFTWIKSKNSIEAKRDFVDTTNPLTHCNGCLALCSGEYTIYYDEKNPYKNFVIAHELSHYLLHHTSDGAEQHHDTNLLASMIIAPKDLILSNGITNATQLSTVCMIPFEVANEYWAELQSNHIISGDMVSTKDYLREIKSMFVNISKLLNNLEAVNKGGTAI